MNIEKNQIDDLNATIKVNLTKEDYEANVNNSLKDIKKKIVINGFRKGMVPMGMVKKMHGNQILFEEVDKLLSKNVSDYLRDNELQILGRPIMEMDEKMVFDIKDMKDYSFNYEIGLVPKFDLTYQNIKTAIPAYKINVDETLVNEEIDRIQKRFGELEEVGSIVEDTDFLRVKLTELNEDETVKEEGIENQSSIMVSQIKDDELLAKLKTNKTGDQFILNITTAFENDRGVILNALLQVDKEVDKSTFSDLYNCEIEKIETRVRADLNEDLFAKVYPNGDIKNKEQLEEKLKVDLAEMAIQRADERLRLDIYNRIVDNTSFDLPDAFLKKFIKYNNEKPISEEQIEGEFDNYKNQLKWEIILGKIIKEKDLKIENEEFFEYVKKDAQKIYGQYLGTSLDEEQIVPFAQNLMKDKQYADKAYNKAMEEKLFTALKLEVKTKEEVIDYKDFNELNK